MIDVIIQARLGSTRLPGKVLKCINGEVMLAHQIKRVKKSKSIGRIIVATTDHEADDPIAEFCKKNTILCFRGSEQDVLSRYYFCAKEFKAETVIRLTADCPLVDPRIIDAVVELYKSSGADYVSNTVPPETSEWPDGSDVEIFSFDALEKAHINAKDSQDREHVTFFFWKNQNQNKCFKTAQLKNSEDWSDYRYTVDYTEDFQVVEEIFRYFSQIKYFPHTEEIVSFLQKNEHIRKLNQNYYFGIGWDVKKKYVK